MFALSLRRAHTRKRGLQINVPSRNAFAHISYTSLQMQMSLDKMLHTRNFMRTQTLKNWREHCHTQLPSTQIHTHINIYGTHRLTNTHAYIHKYYTFTFMRKLT